MATQTKFAGRAIRFALVAPDINNGAGLYFSTAFKRNAAGAVIDSPGGALHATQRYPIG